VDDPEGGWHVRAVKPLQMPGIIGRNEAGVNYAVFNFEIRFHRSPL